MKSYKQLFFTVPLAIILGKEITTYQAFGKFFLYKSPKFYIRQHLNRTGEWLDYIDLSDYDKNNSCNCDIINHNYISSFDMSVSSYF